MYKFSIAQGKCFHSPTPILLLFYSVHFPSHPFEWLLFEDQVSTIVPYCSTTFTHLLKAKGIWGLEVFLPLPADPPYVRWAASCALSMSSFGKFLVLEIE